MADEQVREVTLAVRELLQSARQMQAAAARELGLNITDVQAMDLVTGAAGELSPSELARRLGIRTASASALVDRLERAGHLERAESEARGRFHGSRTRLVAPDSARAELRELFFDINEGFAELAREMSAEDAEVVLDFLRRGRDLMRRFADEVGRSSD